MPQGYDTPIGERGCKLSGALDVETGEKVHLALGELRQGRTTFVIAHRLGTIRSADCIVVLEKGHVVESGTHDQLMSACGRYASMVRRQVRNMALPSFAA